MKRTFCAALLAFSVLAFARAEEGAYRNLVGMAQAAATERGPNPDDAPANPTRGTEALKDAIADIPAPPKTSMAEAGAPRPPAVPAEVSGAAPRLWTRLYSPLRPSRRAPVSARAAALAPAVSTGSFRAPGPLPALMPPPDSEAVKAGERRGMAELLSTTAAPADGQ